MYSDVSTDVLEAAVNETALGRAGVLTFEVLSEYQNKGYSMQDLADLFDTTFDAVQTILCSTHDDSASSANSVASGQDATAEELLSRDIGDDDGDDEGDEEGDEEVHESSKDKNLAESSHGTANPAIGEKAMQPTIESHRKSAPHFTKATPHPGSKVQHPDIDTGKDAVTGSGITPQAFHPAIPAHHRETPSKHAAPPATPTRLL